MKKLVLFSLVLLIYNGTNAQRKFGFINPNGKVVIPLKYENAGNFNEGYAVVLNANKELLIIDKKGNETPIKNKNYDVSFSYYNDFVFSEGLCAVISNKKYGFINTRGEEVIPCEYEKPVLPKNADDRIVQGLPKFLNGVAVVYKNGLYGVINKTGKIVVPIEYQFITHFKNNLAVFQKNISTPNYKGVMDVSGNIIVKAAKYHENIWIEDKNIIRFHYVDGIYTNFYGFYNSKGEEINTENHFTFLSQFENGFALYGTKKAPNYWGIIDALGNTSPLKEKYAFNSNEPSQFRNGYLYPRKIDNKKMLQLNNKGELANNNCEFDYLFEVNNDGIAWGTKGNTNAAFFDVKTCKLIYETDMNGTNSMDYIFTNASKIYPFKGGYTAIKKGGNDFEKKEFEYILIDKKGKTTYSIIGGYDCSLEPDATEKGIYIYTYRNDFDLKKPPYTLYLKGDGTVLYKGSFDCKNFSNGLAAIKN